MAGAHHANVGGSLVLFDPPACELDRETGEDRFESLAAADARGLFSRDVGRLARRVTIESPWPLSEDHYLVAFSFDPLPGMGSGVRRDSETGIYYFDRFGNLELLFREPGICCTGPIPLGRRRRRRP